MRQLVIIRPITAFSCRRYWVVKRILHRRCCTRRSGMPNTVSPYAAVKRR